MDRPRCLTGISMEDTRKEMLALLALIFLMLFFGGLMLFLHCAILVLYFGGVADFLKVLQDLSWTPAYGKTTFFKILVGVAAVNSAAISIYVWQKLFYRKPIFSSNSSVAQKGAANQGRDTGVHLAVGILAPYMAYDAYSRGNFPAALVFAAILIWAIFGFLKSKR